VIKCRSVRDLSLGETANGIAPPPLFCRGRGGAELHSRGENARHRQPPLSLQIQQLEKELGAPLFRRQTRGVELTDAGKLFLEEARVILKHVEMAKIDVRRRARGETGRLIVGSAGATYFHPLVPTIIREYGLKYPNVILAPQASNTALLIARLGAGKIDVAFVWRPTAERIDIAIDPLVDEGTVIVLPAGHVLSKLASVPLAALAKETIVLYPRALNPCGYDSVIQACARAGFRPKLGQEAPQVVSVMPLVASGFGVSIVPRSVSRILVDGVNYLSIEGDAPRAEISLAHRRDDRSPAVQSFVAVARRAARAWVVRKRIEIVKAG
jgi:DNA-binding transcriptional LysR family regulator